MKSFFIRSASALIAATGVAAAAGVFAAPSDALLKPVPATSSSIATQSAMLAAAWAGQRAVVVGANGVVLLSDDHGLTYRQAKLVPVSTTLTSVSFVDAKHGWAAGQWGAILATADGGETWQIQRLDTKTDRPLFSVHFFDARHGVAVGLWSLVLVTQDGGTTWTERQVGSKGGTKSDLNLLDLFADGKGEGGVFATAEKGQLLHSTDYGQTWTYLDTGYNGSLWSGAVLPNGTLLAGGQRGTLMRSDDRGQQWERVPLESKSSITAIAVADQNVLVVGLDGLQAQSSDAGRSFRVIPSGGASFTAALAAPGAAWLKFSRGGIVSSK